jgi:hypothetical protein
MTAVEIARARLAQAAAKRAHPEKRVARTPPRQDDSGTQSVLEGAAESALHRAMTTTADALPPPLPDDVSALRALILAERAEREQLAQRGAQLAERIATVERANAKLEHIVAELKTRAVRPQVRAHHRRPAGAWPWASRAGAHRRAARRQSGGRRRRRRR